MSFPRSGWEGALSVPHCTAKLSCGAVTGSASEQRWRSCLEALSAAGMPWWHNANSTRPRWPSSSAVLEPKLYILDNSDGTLHLAARPHRPCSKAAPPELTRALDTLSRPPLARVSPLEDVIATDPRFGSQWLQAAQGGMPTRCEDGGNTAAAQLALGGDGKRASESRSVLSGCAESGGCQLTRGSLQKTSPVKKVRKC